MKEALKPALEALEEQIRMANGWQSPAEAKAITAIKAALAQEQEPVAWRTFDGEGGYDYRSYEDNESYADEWDKRNPNHKGWVDKLYTTPPQQDPWCMKINGCKTKCEDCPVEVVQQEPVAYLCENAVGHKYFRWKKPSSTYKPIPLYTTPPQPEERNFCPRCGKRTADLTVIHTCTPPQENT